MGRPELPVRGRDLEVRWLVAGVRLEDPVVEDERLVDRVVRQPFEGGALGLGDRAARHRLEELVLVEAEALDRVLVRDGDVLVVVLVIVVAHRRSGCHAILILVGA